MTLDNLHDILGRWEHVKDTAIAERRLAPSCCILASKVLMVEFLDAGFEAWVEPTYAIAANRHAIPLIHAGVHTSLWPDEAWSVGVDPNGVVGDGQGYPGHLVVMVDVGDDTVLLVDGSSGQFSRPQHRMTIPSTLTAPTMLWPEAVSVRTDDWQIDYWPAPLGQQHRIANDWRRNWRELAAEMRNTRV